MKNFKQWWVEVAHAKSPEAQQYAQALLSGKANPYKDTLRSGAPASYDAMFNGDENPPYFIMIQNSQPGHGFGFLAFMHFLNYVGVGEEFASDDFTPAGKSLFNKHLDKLRFVVNEQQSTCLHLAFIRMICQSWCALIRIPS